MTDLVRDRVLGLIERRGKLPPGVDVEAFDYVTSGHVDSIGLIKFVVNLESMFDITITAADMECPSFRTVGGIVSMIKTKLASSAPTHDHQMIRLAQRSVPLFSVIVPVCNVDEFVGDCIQSVFGQTLCSNEFELIVIDDGSTDGTKGVVEALISGHSNARLLPLSSSKGPGAARNAGLSEARGEWIVFVDGDDCMHPDALTRLKKRIAADALSELDAIGYNWAWHSSADGQQGLERGHRQDGAILSLSREELLTHFLMLRMDGSVIYTAVRRSLIARHTLSFASGYHEDVDFLFKIYWHARCRGYLDDVLYFKRERANSIVNTVTEKHLAGFFRAWAEVGRMVRGDEENQVDRLDAYRIGSVGVLATRIREIHRRSASIEEAGLLYRVLYQSWVGLLPSVSPVNMQGRRTKYFMIAATWLGVMEQATGSDHDKAVEISAFLSDILRKSWSCVDLHHSAFLAPDQIRTCCKRFFVDEKIKGDVVLLDKIGVDTPTVSGEMILRAKQALHSRINAGAETPCDGCPFLEFKEWESLGTLDIRYLSMEYQSVCNLRCTYCSETYYGGARPSYDVAALVASLVADQSLSRCHTVVWGGGEPVIDEHFGPLIDMLSRVLPGATQRVLTNAVKHSDVLERLLAANKACMTASIDAGSAETYLKIRGRPRLEETIHSLRSYAASNAAKVTIKYIFTHGNTTLEDVQGFAAMIRDAGLTCCNFQISSDFKELDIPLSAAVLMIVMHALLTDAGCRLIFFDDLLRQRLGEIHKDQEQVIASELKRVGMEHALADPHAYPSVAVWGAGWQAKYLLEKSLFFQTVPVAFFVDSTPSKIGTSYFGRAIVDTDELLKSDVPVLIAAVQGAPAIYDTFRTMGIDESRLIRRLVL